MMQLKKGYDEFYNLAKESSCLVASVDVFDTLLLRDTMPEFKRFLEIAHLQLKGLEGDSHGTAHDLMVQRIYAAYIAYRNAPKVKGVREATYSDVLRTILPTYSMPIEEVFLKAEMGYERSVLKLNRRLLKILCELRELGKKIICVSDMYLPSESIRELVEEKTGGFGFDAVFCSAEYGYGKASSLLYPAVAEALEVECGHIVHCGDSLHSDCLMAIKAGVQGVYTPRSLPWRATRFARDVMFRGIHGLW